jgi:hypothetical protein
MAEQASTHALATNDTPYKLTPLKELHEYEMYVLKNRVGEEKREASIPIMDDPEDKEGILRCNDEFSDACGYNSPAATCCSQVYQVS